jgi:chromatin segregation and condensation protein Rec8/ScpA/Scc1 (kleisin family)
MFARLRNMIREKTEIHLSTFFEQARSRRELVLAFLSILELVRATELTLHQAEVFGDIIARARS